MVYKTIEIWQKKFFSMSLTEVFASQLLFFQPQT
jgi:hypothetical protein